MKSIFTFLALLVAVAGQSQCSISDVSIRNVAISGQTATFGMSFKHSRNSGNKWVTIHIWAQSAYPDYSYSQVPTASRLSGHIPIGTVVINNSVVTGTGTYTASQAFAPSYQNDGSFPMATAASSVLTYDNASGIYVLTGLSIIMPPGTVTLEIDSWSSQSNSNQVVHCWDKTISPIINSDLIAISAVIGCPTSTLSLSIHNSDITTVTGSYKVFADHNNTGTLDGLDPIVYTSGSITITPGSSYVSPGISIPAVYMGDDLYIQFMPTSGLSVAQRFTGCTVSLSATGMESFKAWKDGSYAWFSWTTQTESNCDYYIVQRRSGTDWIDMVIVNSKATDGNSQVSIAYTASYPLSKAVYSSMMWVGLLFLVSLLCRRFVPARLLVIVGFLGIVACGKSTIDQIAQGTSTDFRLKQVDLDGKASYSPFRSVKL